MQVPMGPMWAISRHNVKSSTLSNVLCYDGTIARHVTGVYDKDNSFCVRQILAELITDTRVTGNIDQSDGFLVG